MQRLGITQSLADSLEDAAHSNTSTPQRLNASTPQRLNASTPQLNYTATALHSSAQPLGSNYRSNAAARAPAGHPSAFPAKPPVPVC